MNNLEARLNKLTVEQLKKAIAQQEKDIERIEKQIPYYEEVNRKDPHLKFYNLEPYRVWQSLIRRYNECKESLEIGYKVLSNKVKEEN